LREEEKIAIEKYAKQHGEKEMDQIFINDRMNELKLEILEHASSELFKENNKKIIAQREAERKARDEAIK